MTERWRPLAALGVLASWLVPAALLLATYRSVVVPALEIVAWALLMGAGDALRVRARSGSRYSVGLAVAIALPLVIDLPGSSEPDIPGVVVALSLGLMLSWLVRRAFRDPAGRVAGAILGRAAGLAAFVSVYLMMRGVTSGLGAGLSPDTSELLELAAAAGSLFGVETLLRALFGWRADRGPFWYRWQVALADWMVPTSLLATGGLFGFAWPKVGWWAFPVAGLPYAISHLAFIRLHDTRATYRQTIRALARIPELGGLSPLGHSDRVTALAVAIAEDLGLRPSRVADVEWAAILHDVGRVALNEPNIIKMGFNEDDIARWGYEILTEAPHLHGVARVVREQHHPYRRPGEEQDPELPMPSKIIRAASAYDHATSHLSFSRLEALELLHREAAYEFDPDVVQSLRRVVEGRVASEVGVA